MTQRLPAIFGRFNRERFRSGRRENAGFPLHVLQSGDRGSLDRQTQFSHLLARIKAYGVRYYEREIDQIRTVDHLNESEREIALEIFRFGYEAAEKEHRQDKMAAYQRLLRRLLLHQPLDQPIPLDNDAEEITPRETLHVPEPSVTQQSPKQGDVARPVTTAPVPDWVLRYTLCSIGAGALIWTAFALRSPIDVRDSVVPVRGNQENVGRAPAAQADRLEPLAHASALTPPAEIAPVTEGATAGTTAPTSDAINDDGATSAKSPAILKFNTPAEAGKIRSPAKVANQAATVDPARGNNSEREPARDSLPIYQTQRRILLREEPRFGAPAQIMLERGARLIVLEINGPWLKVKMENNGTPGFVREEFVAPVATAPAKVTSPNRG